MRLLLVAVFACFTPTLSVAQEPGASRDLTSRFEVPDGLAVTLWAESPALYNPTAMDVDARGRIWVSEAVNYRKWRGRNPGRDHPKGDRILILEDSDGDGAADKTTVFAQDAELTAPLGICVLGSRVIVSCSPKLLVFTDEDGDDRADRKEVFLDGFGGFDHDHGLHSVTIGPDGRLYFNAGNAGPHVVTDRAGRTLRSGSSYTGGGPAPAPNRPGLRSDDGRVWTGGLVLRMNPDGTDLTVLAHNFRNPYEVAVDAFGDLWQSDNDDDGNGGCRTTWVMRGGNYGFFSTDGARSWQADRRPGQNNFTAHWRQDDPGVAPAGCRNGPGGPTGVAMYEHGALPQVQTGTVLNCDAGASAVYGHVAERREAGFELRKTIFLGIPKAGGGDRARWFRPSDVVVGTDGAVYVSDWWDPGVGGHRARDGEAYGRILRVAPKGTNPRPPALDLDTVDGLVAALQNPAVQVRGRAAWKLRTSGHDGAEALEKLFASGNPRTRARSLYVRASMPQGGDIIAKGLQDPDEKVRIAALRALQQNDSDWLAVALERAADPSPAVRAELATMLRDTPFEDCMAQLIELARGYDGQDRSYLEAYGIAADGKEALLYPELLARLGDQPQRWTQSFARLAWRLHPEAAVPALLARAFDASLSDGARLEAVTALAFSPGRDAAEAMLSIAQGGPDDVRPVASWWIMNRDGNDWREYQLSKDLGISRDGAELRFESEIMTDAGTVDVDVDITGARTLWLEVTDGKKGKSCDWADWIEPRLVGPAGETQLTDLQWTSASTGWGRVLVNKNTRGGPLSIGGMQQPSGIGTHAPSQIVFQIPDRGYTRFRAKVGPDDGGTRQGNATDIQFRVYVDTEPAEPDDLAELRSQLLDAKASIGDRSQAATMLAKHRRGGAMVVELAARGELPDAVRAAVAGAIFDNPDVSIRALATQHFKRPGTPAQFPSIPELISMRGDPRRGEEIYFGGQAICATCHTWKGRGGTIGPDLTNTRAKYGAEGLFDAILNPSAGISFGYETWIVETTDGGVIAGFILADGDNVVIKDTAGQRHVIPSSKIKKRSAQEQSLMPDSATLGMSTQDLVDLVSFLLRDPADRSLGEPIQLFNGTDLSGWTHHLREEKAQRTDVWSVTDGVLACSGRPAGYVRTEADYENFVLTLEWRFPPGGKPGNSGVLLRMTGEDKVWPKSIEAQLHHRNAGDIWNIDKVPMHVSPARTNGRRTVKLEASSEKPIGEWNHYEITLDGGDLTLVVNGVLQNEATGCERVAGKICLQSEGAPIEFRNIVLRPIQ